MDLEPYDTILLPPTFRMLQLQRPERPSSHGEQLSAEEFEFSLTEDDLELANRQKINQLEKELKEMKQQLSQVPNQG